MLQRMVLGSPKASSLEQDMPLVLGCTRANCFGRCRLLCLLPSEPEHDSYDITTHHASNVIVQVCLNR